MAAVVERVDRVAIRAQAIGHVNVAIAVLAGAVNDHDQRPRLAVGTPALPEDSPAAGAGQQPGRVDHVSSVAHGTMTASSVGESRATTYSAASVSDGLTSTCVSRGGTYTMSPGSSSSS